MTVTRTQVLAEARTWLGTRYHDQASVKGVGCDCGGLIRGVMMALGLAHPDERQWGDAAEFAGYAREPDGVSLLKACRKYLVPIAYGDAQAGDVVAFKMIKYPQHLGIIGESPSKKGELIHKTLIHACSTPGICQVIETRLIFARKSEFVAAFAMPGVV